MVPVLFLMATTLTTNDTSNEDQTGEDTKSQSSHILPTVLVISVLLVISILLAWYFLRLRNQRKEVVTTVDKKIPNGILEEQGDIVDIIDISEALNTPSSSGCDG
eukprot:XP_014071777.1 PREDICTED: receptor-type tyrosine-protein phosphatase epsilon-like isoform X2 [Salmo salar]